MQADRAWFELAKRVDFNTGTQEYGGSMETEDLNISASNFSAHQLPAEAAAFGREKIMLRIHTLGVADAD